MLVAALAVVKHPPLGRMGSPTRAPSVTGLVFSVARL